MEILPLEYRPKQESLIASMKKVHANDVYTKSIALKHQAKFCFKSREQRRSSLLILQPSGRVCSHHKSLVSARQGHSQHWSGSSGIYNLGGGVHSSCKSGGPSRGISAGGGMIQNRSSTHARNTDKQERASQENLKSSSGVGNRQVYPIGLHVGSSNNILTTENHINANLAATEYSHFQNVTLAKELADSRTISLDRADALFGSQDEAIMTQTIVSEAANSPTRQTILSKRETASHDELEQTFQRRRSIDKRNMVNAEIIGSLKSGYGFLPNFSQPNNQGSRVKRSDTVGQTAGSRTGVARAQLNSGGDMRIFARSPGAISVDMQLSPLSKRHATHTQVSNKRPTLTERPLSSKEKPAPSKTSDQDKESASHTDRVSSPQAINQCKYGGDVEKMFHNAVQVLQTCVAEAEFTNQAEPIKEADLEYTPSPATVFGKGTSSVTRQKLHLASGGQLEPWQGTSSNKTQGTKDLIVDFNSQSLYERYNKLINNQSISVVNAAASDSSPLTAHLAKTTTPSNNLKQMAAPCMAQISPGPKSKRFPGKQKSNRRKRRQPYRATSDIGKGGENIESSVEQQDRGQSQGQQNQITIVVFKDNTTTPRLTDKRHKKRSKSSANVCGAGVAGAFKKVTTRGVPIQKKDGRLRSLRPTDRSNGQVPLCPFQHQSTLLQPQGCSPTPQMATAAANTSPEGSATRQTMFKVRQMENSQQTSQQKLGQKLIYGDLLTNQLSGVKGIDRLNLQDTVSEGTNRISATQIKLKQSKMSDGQQATNLSALKESQVTFDQDQQRRSLEIQKMRSKTGVSSEVRNQTKSKSIDSTGAVSNLHDMLKPKGIEVYSQSIGASENGTPNNAKKVAQLVLHKVSTVQSHKNLEPADSQNTPKPAQDASPLFQPTFDDRQVTSVPQLELGLHQINSGEIVTAKLQSSASERAVSIVRNKSIHDETVIEKQQDPGVFSDPAGNEVVRVDDENQQSQASSFSSIRTSIDDDTLMELAKKGITAKTPVLAEDSNMDAQEGANQSLNNEALNETFGDRLNVKGESPDSTHNIHMNSKLLEQKSEDKQNMSALALPHSSKEEELDRVASDKSSRSIVYSQQSPTRIKPPSKSQTPLLIDPKTLNQQLVLVNQTPEVGTEQTINMPVTVSSLETQLQQVTSVDQWGDSLENFVHQQHKYDRMASFQTKKQPLKSRSRKGNKFPFKTQKTEMEAESQTDFAPLPILDPKQFSFDGMNANFDTNLMFVPEEGEAGAALQDFSIAAQLNYPGAQPDSILEQPENRHTPLQAEDNASSPLKFDGKATGYIQPGSLLPPPAAAPGQVSDSMRPTAFNLTNFSDVQTANVLSRLSLRQLQDLGQNPAMITGVMIKNEQGRDSQGSPVRSPLRAERLIRNEQRGEQSGIVEAVAQGKRIICNNVQGTPIVVNMRPQEQLSSPTRHHTIVLTGKPLQPVSLQERTQENRQNNQRSKRILKSFGNRNSNLSKDFRHLTDNLMAGRKSVEGVDKSIGEETSHSSGSYTSKRKFYILNIDKKSDGVNLATYKSRQSQGASKDDFNTTQVNQFSLNNSVLSKDPVSIENQKGPANLLEQEGLLTDRNRHKTDRVEKPVIDDKGALSSSRQKTHSRQEDLETVYMQSTIQFNKDPTGGQHQFFTYQAPHLRGSKTGQQISKSPDPQMRQRGDYAPVQLMSELSNNQSVEERPSEEDELNSGRANLLHPSIQAGANKINVQDSFGLGMTMSQQNVSSERRQIQLKNGQPINNVQASVALAQETMKLRMSAKKKVQSHQVPRDAHVINNFGEFAAQQRQIQILDESNVANQVRPGDLSVKSSFEFPSKHSKKVVMTSGRNSPANAHVSMSKNKYTTNYRVDEIDVDSNKSLQKLIQPVAAAIQVKPSNKNLTKPVSPDTLTDSAGQDTRKTRPKTTEANSKQQVFTASNPAMNSLRGDDKTPHGRKVIFLMHKRREIALRRGNQRFLCDSEDISPHLWHQSSVPGAESTKIAIARMGQTGRPTFFSKVSQQLSRVFSLDRSQARFASSMARMKNQTQSKGGQKSQRIKQAQFHEKRQTLHKSSILPLEVPPEELGPTRVASKQRMKMHLTINPCSNSSLYHPNRQHPFSLRTADASNARKGTAATSQHQRGRNADFKYALNTFSPQSTTSHVHFESGTQTSSRGRPEYPLNQFEVNNLLQNHKDDGAIGDRQKILDALIQGKQEQRVGLKTAENGKRPRKLATTEGYADPSKVIAATFNQSIDLNSRFRGFDRRQAHDTAVQKIKVKFHSKNPANMASQSQNKVVKQIGPQFESQEHAATLFQQVVLDPKLANIQVSTTNQDVRIPPKTSHGTLEHTRARSTAFVSTKQVNCYTNPVSQASSVKNYQKRVNSSQPSRKSPSTQFAAASGLTKFSNTNPNEPIDNFNIGLEAFSEQALATRSEAEPQITNQRHPVHSKNAKQASQVHTTSFGKVDFERQVRVNQVIHASTSAADCDLGILPLGSYQEQEHANLLGDRSKQMCKSFYGQITGPTMHTESRKRARLLKQGLTYRRNQAIKMIQSEQANALGLGLQKQASMPFRNTIEELFDSGSSGQINNLELQGDLLNSQR